MTSYTIPAESERGASELPAFVGPILVATDGRRDADAALRAARLLADRTGAAIDVLSVIERVPVAAPEALTPAYADSIAAARAEQLARVRAQIERVLGSGAARLELTDGSPAEAISRRAHDLQASLVIVGLGGHGVMDRLFGSETAMHLLRLSSVPVLAVPPDLTALPTNVVAATDFSDCAMGALQVAFPLLGTGARVTATHVIARELSAAIWDARHESYDAEVAEQFQGLGSRVAPPPGITLEQRVLHGDPVPALLHFAAVMHADLIVTGTHGHNFISRILLGSTATGLVRGARVAVLAVPQSAAERTAAAVRPLRHESSGTVLAPAF